jgi:general secretion pathway protein D
MKNDRHGWNHRFTHSFMMVLMLTTVLVYGCVPKEATRIEAEAKKYEAQKDYDAAVAHYTRALQQTPDDIGLKARLMDVKQQASLQYMRKAMELLEKRYFKEAIEELQVSIAFYPGNYRSIELIDKARKMKESEYYTQKGLARARAGDFDSARLSFQKAVDLDPENQEAAQALDRFKKMPSQIPEYGLDLRYDKPISMKFKNTPILNVFEVLSKLTGMNFIFDKDIRESKVTLFMTEVGLDLFLDVLLQTNALKAKVINRNSLIIYPDAPAKAKEYDELYVKTFYLSYLKAPEAIALLTKLLRNDNIIVNEKINAVTVRGPEPEVKMAARVIQANDRAPSEVILNVEVMEVSRNREKDLGLSISDTVTFGKGDTSGTNPDENSGTVSGFEPLTSIEDLSNISRKELFLSLPTATLRLLRKDGDTKILAKPQVRVNSLEKASILIGERVPLRTNRRVQTDGSITYDFQYQDVGVKLVTEPVINAYDQVTLKMHIEISALGANVGTVTDPQFAIKTRTVETILTVYDGDSVIIGGLIEDRDRISTQKVPLLGEMPTLGRLFSSENTEQVETDILLTITPVVIRNQDIPPAKISGFWSGTHQRVSMEPPAAETVKAGLSFNDVPDEDFIKKTMDDLFLPSDNYFSIQAYSFPDEAQAESKAEQLEKTGYRTWIRPAQIEGKGTWYRVFVGQYRGYSQAEKALQQMRGQEIFPKNMHVVDRDYVYGTP